MIFHCLPQTSIFTPSFGTPTKVRISSTWTTNQVIEQLLNKFKVSFCALDTCWPYYVLWHWQHSTMWNMWYLLTVYEIIELFYFRRTTERNVSYFLKPFWISWKMQAEKRTVFSELISLFFREYLSIFLCMFILQIENDPQEFALYCVHQSGGTLCLLYITY